MKSKKLKLILTVCIGLTLTIIATAGVYVFDPPSPPRALQIDDITETSCKIIFLHPSNDGGSRVTGYIIEVKDAYFDLSWRPYALTPSTKYLITGRKPGSFMKIQVRAQNVAGLSDPARIVVKFPEVN